MEYTLEELTQIVVSMCKNHPEICPHDYEKIAEWNDISKGSHVHVTRYKCKLCKHITNTVKEIDSDESH